MVPSQLQQRRTLQCGVAAAAKRLFEPGAELRIGEVAVGRGDDERGARQDPQDLGDALARLEESDAARRQMGVIGKAIPRRGEIGIALGRDQAAAHGLHRSDQIDQVLDRLLVLLQAHRIGQGKRQAEGELGLRQPIVEVMPAQPARDRFGRRIDEENALPRDQHVIEPHLAVELVVAAGERRDKRVLVADRELAAQNRNARRGDRHDEARALPADFEPR